MVQVTLKATLKRGDTGDPIEGKTIVFYIDGSNVGASQTNSDGIATKTVDVSAGQHTARAEFAGDDTYEGSYDEKTFTVEEGQPSFEITSWDTSVNVNAGEQFTVTATIHNKGTADGQCRVQLVDHNGTVQDENQLTLPADQYVSTTLVGTAPSTEGSYTYKIRVYNMDTGTYDDEKTLTVNVSGGGGGGGETPSLGFDCYELARLMMMGEVMKILSGKEPDISKVVGLMIQCKMMEVLMSQLSGS